jgi:hypothetical protein
MNPMASITKVSVTAESVRSLTCLKRRLVANPETAPITTDTTAIDANCPTIIHGVFDVKWLP